jgi:hypothetical protein
MKKLIEALQIFLKYNNKEWPTHCEHDILMVVGITEEEVSQEDKDKLEVLGFTWCQEYDCWASFLYGSS